MKILYIVTTAETARGSLKGQLDYIQRKGNHKVELISSPGSDLKSVAEREDIQVHPIGMSREISLFRDALSLLRICWKLLWIRPDIVVAGTPKAGLLGMLAAFLTFVPRRVYLLKGLRLDTTSGTKRGILACMEKLASGCATEVISVSQSLKGRYVELGLASKQKIFVLGNGTSNGISATKFCAEKYDTQAVKNLKVEYNIPVSAPVLGFVGRLVADKGISELLECFRFVSEKMPETQLVLVGRHEAGDGITDAESRYIREHENIHELGFRSDVESIYALMDVFLFPSQREGFPKAPLEAGLMRVPTVAFDAVGSVDAVQDKRTGFIVPAGDQGAFNQKTLAYLQNPEIRKKHGQAAEEWILKSFNQEEVWQQYLDWFDGSVEPRNYVNV